MKTNKILLATLMVSPLLAFSCKGSSKILNLPLEGYESLCDYGNNEISVDVGVGSSLTWADSPKKEDFQVSTDGTAIAGKVFESVSKVDARHIKLKFTGNATTPFTTEGAKYIFNIKPSAFQGETVEKATCTLNLARASLATSGSEISGDVSIKFDCATNSTSIAALSSTKITDKSKFEITGFSGGNIAIDGVSNNKCKIHLSDLTYAETYNAEKSASLKIKHDSNIFSDIDKDVTLKFIVATDEEHPGLNTIRLDGSDFYFEK